MKKFVCILIAMIFAIPVCVSATEAVDMTVSASCDKTGVEIGDQFMVNFEISDVKKYLTFQMKGTFDSELAELIAPVYSNPVLGILENNFDNEMGTFSFVGYDQQIRGTDEPVVCSVLFEAKKAGDFSVILTEPMLGKADENAFYVLETKSDVITIGEDVDGEQSVIIKDAEPLTPYDDMLEYDWAEKAVGVMYKLGVLENIADTSFKPGENITRGEFLTMLVKVCKLKNSNKEAFPDVSEESYQYNPMLIAKGLGIAKGDENGNFRPDDAITRQDVCALVFRTMLKMNKVNPEITAEDYLAEFSDVDKIAFYAVEPVAGLMRAKLITGDDTGLFRPCDNMTRAEAAVLLNRLAEFNILVSRS